MSQPNEAARLLKYLSGKAERKWGRSDYNTLKCYNNLAKVYSIHGKPEKASELFEQIKILARSAELPDEFHLELKRNMALHDQYYVDDPKKIEIERLAEIYVQNHSTDDTHFITTRFGNVLGSSGSVIPLFKKQLLAGGPLTITHKDITRYFMTIPEACNLVLEAGAMGTGGDIFVFDMGRAVKIYDLAVKMIQLSGLQDIEIKEIGLRPGEKLYEELLASKENTIPTHNSKILRAQVASYPVDQVEREYSELLELIPSMDPMKLVAKMKHIVPEFISNNSIFCELDNTNC